MNTIEIKESNRFSARRFALLMKSDFDINKKNYLKLSIGFIGVFFAFAVISTVVYYSTGGDYKGFMTMSEMVAKEISFSDIQISNIMYLSFSVWTVSLGLTIFGSLTFSSMGSKKGRIATLMQPASMIEKFLLRFLIYFIGGLLTLAIGFFLGVLMCQLVYNGGAQIFRVINFFFFTSDGAWPFTLFLVLWTLLMDGIYTIGSSIWPKLSWVKTWVVMMAIQWVLGSFLISGVMANLNIPALVNKIEDSLELIWWIGISVLVILNVGCWIIAWWRFRTTQIVQRFMSK